ncbi:hypothetical protein [Rhizobium sp. 21-4511-3d]
MGQNETEQHFQVRDLNGDMRRASAEAFQVNPKEHARRLRGQNRALLVLLAIVVGVSCYLFGIF